MIVIPARLDPRDATVRARLYELLLSGIALWFIYHSLAFIVRYHYPIAWWDFWNWVEDYRRYDAGNYRFSDLFAFHNEHRIFTTRLFLFADAWFGHMSGIIPLTANVLCLALIGVALQRLIFPGPGAPRPIPALFFAACMLSICQWENLVSPFQIGFALQLGFVVAAAMLLARSTSSASPSGRSRLYFLGGLSCFVMATLSMAGGLLSAPALFLLLLLRRAGPLRLTIFAACATITALLYVRHMASPAPSQSWAPTLFYLDFTARLLGGALSAFPAMRKITGCVLLTAAAISCAVLCRRAWTGQSVSENQAALLAIAGFAVASAASASIERASIGLHGADAPRYSCISILLAISIIGLIAPRMPARLPPRGREPAIVAFLVFCVIALTGINDDPNYAGSAGTQRAALDWTGQSLRANVNDWPPYGAIDYRTAAARAPALRFLRARRLNMFRPDYDPPAWASARLQASLPQSLPRCAGALDSAVALDSHRYTLTGWLANSTARTTAPWIGVVSANGAQTAIEPEDVERPEIRALRHMRRGTTGFHAAIDSVSPPAWVVGFYNRPGQDCAMPVAGALSPIMVQPLPPAQSIRMARISPVLYTGSFARATPSPDLAAPWPNWPFAKADGQAPATAEAVVQWTGAPGDALFIPFAIGLGAPTPRIRVRFADGTETEITLPGFRPALAWRAAVLPSSLIAAHGGGPMQISVVSSQGVAPRATYIGAPAIALADLDAARLY